MEVVLGQRGSVLEAVRNVPHLATDFAPVTHRSIGNGAGATQTFKGETNKTTQIYLTKQKGWSSMHGSMANAWLPFDEFSLYCFKTGPLSLDPPSTSIA